MLVLPGPARMQFHFSVLVSPGRIFFVRVYLEVSPTWRRKAFCRNLPHRANAGYMGADPVASFSPLYTTNDPIRKNTKIKMKANRGPQLAAARAPKLLQTGRTHPPSHARTLARLGREPTTKGSRRACRNLSRPGLGRGRRKRRTREEKVGRGGGNACHVTSPGPLLVARWVFDLI